MANFEPHIKCSKDLDVKYTIVPGDPMRVDRVAEYLENPQLVAFNREYKSIIGYYKGIKILAISSGIGGPSTAIALEELKNIGIEAAIRIGSCGALLKHIKLGDLIISQAAVRDDGTSKTYIKENYPAVADIDLLNTSIECAKSLKYNHHVGIVRSHDSFYIDDEDEISRFWGSKNIFGADMETSSLYVIGRLRGIKTLSILNVVVESEENTKEGIGSYVNGLDAAVEGEKREIILALETIYKFHNK
ncbi:MAG: nucleoside phosphorylase [Caloramator sp.]|nr:nucleoside phosphorylase [Caloramator sp.]